MEADRRLPRRRTDEEPLNVTIETRNQTQHTSAVDETPTCPLCHTPAATMTNAALVEGAYWRCHRCGQSWDAISLQTVADYARWSAARDADLAMSSGKVAPDGDSA